MSIDYWSALTIALTFILAGAVKGAAGIGLPTVALALLAATIGLDKAVPIILVPSVVTNIWQGTTGGHFLYVVRRLWPFLLAMVVSIFVGVRVAANIDADAASFFLGVSLVAYAAVGLAGFVVSVPPARVGRVGMGLGCVNGVLTGMTGSFAFPGIPFIKSIGMAREATLQAMGVFMTVASFFLGAALMFHDRFPMELGVSSALAVFPALAGMGIGRSIGRKVSDRTFNFIFLNSMLFMGVYILVSPWLG